MNTGWQEDGSYVPCPKCNYIENTTQNKLTPFSKPIHTLGVATHNPDCPTLPHLTLEQQRELQAQLTEMARCRARAWAAAHNYWVY